MASEQAETMNKHTGKSAPNTAGLRPWKPGQSGNPSGRPKGIERRIRELTNDGEDILEILASALKAEGQFEDINHKDRIHVAEIMLDRGWGKALATSINVSADAGQLPDGLLGASDAILEALARRLSQAGRTTVEVLPAVVSAVKAPDPDRESLPLPSDAGE